MFCSQRCASKGVIRCTAPALYLENASESAESRKFSHFHSKHLPWQNSQINSNTVASAQGGQKRSNSAVDYSIKDMLGEEYVTNPAAGERQMGLCLYWCAIYSTFKFQILWSCMLSLISFIYMTCVIFHSISSIAKTFIRGRVNSAIVI